MLWFVQQVAILFLVFVIITVFLLFGRPLYADFFSFLVQFWVFCWRQIAQLSEKQYVFFSPVRFRSPRRAFLTVQSAQHEK